MSQGTSKCHYYKSVAKTGDVYSPKTCKGFWGAATMAFTGCSMTKTLLSKGSQSQAQSKACAIEGGVSAAQINNVYTTSTTDSNTTFHDLTNIYSKFTTAVSSSDQVETNLNFTESQSISITNNMDITLDLTTTVGSITDTTFTLSGMDITNNFAYGFTTGPDTLGTRTIQDTQQSSTSSSNQGTSLMSNVGYTSKVTSKASNWTKAVNVMKDSLGPYFPAVLVLIFLLVGGLVWLWIAKCNNKTLCRQLGFWPCSAANERYFTNMPKGERYKKIKEQLLTCSTMKMTKEEKPMLLKNLKWAFGGPDNKNDYSEKVREEAKEFLGGIIGEQDSFNIRYVDEDGKRTISGFPLTDYEDALGIEVEGK